ncbi:hypothetical protein GEMRC1_008555 [Eukaryota sp. GEM-RC1]
MRELDSPPSDTISRVRFSPTSPNLLLASSWDNSVRIYDIESSTIKNHYVHNGAVLDCCYGHDLYVASGGLDKKLLIYHTEHNSITELGSHEGPISCVDYSPSSAVYATGSWDKSVKLWDARSSSCASTMVTTGKVYAMGIIDTTLIVGLSGRTLSFFDLRNFGPLRHIESPLKYQLRSIGTSQSSKLYGIGSIEGRVCIDSLDETNRFAFKCHRKKSDQKTFVYPVNSIAFHPVHPTSFATGGSDGVVSLWDGAARSKRKTYTGFRNPVSCVDFSCDGKSLAIASSYNFEEGERKSQADAIYVQDIVVDSLAPKG